jgi:hypothetical protein
MATAAAASCRLYTPTPRGGLDGVQIGIHASQLLLFLAHNPGKMCLKEALGTVLYLFNASFSPTNYGHLTLLFF